MIKYSKWVGMKEITKLINNTRSKNIKIVENWNNIPNLKERRQKGV